MRKALIAKRKIHRRLKKKTPHGVKKAKKLVSFKYPKLFFLLVSIIIAYFIFSRVETSNFVNELGHLNYIGTFIAGILIAFGFTAPFSVGFFITSTPSNLFLATIIGGLGATFGDMIIFKTIKFSFMNEFNELKKTKTIRKIRKIAHGHKYLLIKHYLFYIFAGIIIATPLPDEVGVSMLAGLSTINPRKLAVVAFILHTFAIFCLLYFSVGA